MKNLEKTIVVLALLALIGQTIRHAYMLWFEPRGSVLDKFDKPKEDIKAITSLDELVRRYEAAHKQAEEGRQEIRQQRAQNRNRETVVYADQETEPYKSENELHSAIDDWERKANEVHELRFFWTIGLVLMVPGGCGLQEAEPLDWVHIDHCRPLGVYLLVQPHVLRRYAGVRPALVEQIGVVAGLTGPARSACMDDWDV